MCGIAGFTGEGEPHQLDRMLLRLVHRGPDDAGRHIEPGVALGARRLRVIDLEGGHQPFTNETGTVWVALNGEIYNYRALRDELIRKGHQFTSHCDTEVLVHLYEQEGEEGVRRLRGMFAYALWDRDRHTLLLVRDRFGIKPLYYARRGMSSQGVAFASELPALLAALPQSRIDPAAISQYLTRLYIPGPDTIFQNVAQVGPGEVLRIRDGSIDSWRYDRPEHAMGGTFERHPSAAAERFREVLKDTVQAHLVSDVPLGLFLSGGLDSGALLAAMRQVVTGPIRTFSIGYAAEADRSYDETTAARAVAAHFGTDHCEERLNPDAVQLLPRIVAAMGEPFADASSIPTYLVSQVARRHVTVALSGIGGDELFGGYPRYLGLRAASRYALVPRALRTWIATAIAPRLPESTSSSNRRGRLRRFLRDGHAPIAQQYLAWISFLPPEWNASALTSDLLAATRNVDTSRGFVDLFDAWPSADPSDRAMGLDLQTYLTDDLLRMGDRLSMAHSLELRVPFCDQELLALACRIPTPMRFAGWSLKGFMREALRPWLPASVLDRPKSGFQVPLARWLKEDLRDLVHDLLSDRAVRARGYVKPEYVHWLIRQHESGGRNLSDQLYALVVLELWHQQYESGAFVTTSCVEAASR